MNEREHARLKVLMVTTTYPSQYDPVAGVFFKDHARAVALYDDVTVICSYPKPRPKTFFYKWISLHDENEDGVRTIRLEFPKISKKIDAILSIILAIFTGRKLIKQKKCDVIHAQKVFPSGFIAAVLSKAGNRATIITEHSDNFNHVMGKLYRRPLIDIALNNTQDIIAVSKFARNSMLQAGVHKNIRVIPNPVDLARFKLHHFTIKKVPPVKKILHVSTFEQYQKGFIYLLKAIKEVSKKRTDFLLSIIGGTPDVQTTYEQAAEKMEILKYFKFYGRLDRETVIDHYNECNFFVLSSIRESFGVVLIEAMACGKPVIATKCGGPQEIVTEDTGLLVPPEDVNELVKAIEFMLDNYQKYDPDKIREYVSKNFSYSAIGCQIDKAYREVLSKK